MNLYYIGYVLREQSFSNRIHLTYTIMKGNKIILPIDTMMCSYCTVNALLVVLTSILFNFNYFIILCILLQSCLNFLNFIGLV